MRIYPVTSNVEMPGLGFRVKKYPFDEMEVGDSVLIELDKHDGPTIYASVKRSAYRLAGKKFMVRSVRGKSGMRTAIRVWRTS